MADVVGLMPQRVLLCENAWQHSVAMLLYANHSGFSHSGFGIACATIVDRGLNCDIFWGSKNPTNPSVCSVIARL